MSNADFLLKLDGIEGECEDLKHKGELQISSYSRGSSNPRDAATGEAEGKSIWDDAHFTMRVDKALTKLLLACGHNQIISKVILTCRKVGGKDSSGKSPGQEYLIITFNDAMISSCRLHGSSDADPTPILDFSMSYARITEDYCAQTPQGTLAGAVSYSHAIGRGT
jgi:type VI secretion system secreted protein Hcp